MDLLNRDKQADLMLLADAFFENLEREEYCEYGGWGLDDKRPFGNSDVERDILEIIGVFGPGYDEMTPEAEEYAAHLYDDLGSFLKKCWRGFKYTLCWKENT